MALVEQFVPKKIKDSFFLGLILIFTFFFFLYGLGSYGLLNNNEGLYSQIAKDMAASLSEAFSLQKWIIPSINGLPYIEKPPLLYWLTALSFQCFGISEFSARLVPALSGVLLVGGGYTFFARLSKPTYMFPALMILLSSLGFVIFSRMVFFEGLLTCLCTLSLLWFYLWYAQEKNSDLYLSYLFLGLACLTKGFAPVCLVGLIILSFFIMERSSWRKVLGFFNPLGISLFCLTVFPWLICADLYEKDFFWFYVINEHVLRFLGQRLPKDYYSGPIYYYILRILGYLFPWTFFLGLFFLKTTPLPPSEKTLHRFLWLWFFIPLAFFSLSQAKANYYMIIGIFPLATLLGIKLSLLTLENRWTSVLILKGITQITILGILVTPLFLSVPYLEFSSWAFLSALGAILFFETLSRSLPPIRLCTLLVQIACLSGILLIWILHSMGSVQNHALISSKSLSTKFLPFKERPVLFYRNYEELSSLPFYLDSPFFMLDSQSADLEFARTHPCSLANFLTSETIPPSLLTFHPLVVVHPKSLRAFQSSPLAHKAHLLIEQEGVSVFELTSPQKI